MRQSGTISTKDSVGFDSIAPPCYTSQKDEASIMARSSTPVNDDDDSTIMSMHSFPDDATAQFLPSPYSAEDLRGAASSSDADPGPSVTYVESSNGNVTPPHTSSDVDYSATPTQAATTYQMRYARHSSMPATSPYASYRGISRPSEEMYNQSSSSQPTDVGHLTYRRPRERDSYADYYDANEELASDDDGRDHPMNSTITFVPEPTNASAPQLVAEKAYHKPRAKLTKASSKKAAASGKVVHAEPERKAAKTVEKKEKKSPVLEQKQPEPVKPQTPVLEPEVEPEGPATNFVALSRKSTFVKPKLFRPAPAPSSITGHFIIDPTLYIPSSVLKAVESPGKRALDIATAARQALTKGINTEPKPDESNPQNSIRQKNLVLEVENGGIDVDVHLLPFPKQSIYNGSSQPASEINSRRMSSANAFTPPTRFSLDGYRQSEESHSRTALGNVQRQRTRSSVDGYGTSAVSSIRKYSLPIVSRPTPLPTLLDIRLKEMRGIKRKSSGSTKPKNEHSLVARIHAPNPRPPFHLIASTVDIMPLFRPIPPAEANKTDNKPSSGAPPAPRIVRPPPNRARPIHTLPRSTLTLCLPRTFHGPLTVNIGAGDIDAHLRLSRGLAAAAVVLAESPYSRGFFVGRLAELAAAPDAHAYADLGADWVVMGDPAAVAAAASNDGEEDELASGSGEGTLRPSGRALFRDMSVAGTDSQSHERMESSTTAGEEETKGDEEWKGDKVDVHGGHGKVYLQFMDEEDPFGKKGHHFWTKIGWRSR